MLKAYYPIIYLSTFEYDKAKQQIRGLIKQMPIIYQYFEWNIVDGLVKKDINTGNTDSIDSKEEPEELLKFVSEQLNNDTPQLFVL